MSDAPGAAATAEAAADAVRQQEKTIIQVRRRNKGGKKWEVQQVLCSMRLARSC